jgi:hypothetical protein
MARIHQRSFGGGVIAPEMLGRIDLNHYQTGLSECLNFYPLPHGPVVNRPGFQYIKEVKDGGSASTRVIPFIFNTEQAYCLEFGNLYLRIHTEGSTVLEANTTISGATQANPCVVTDTGHGYLDGEEVYISSIVGMTELNGRYFKVANKTTNTFEITDLQGNNINSSAYTAYGSAGTAGRVYTVVTPYATADLFQINYTQSADVMTLVHPSHAPRELKRLGATNWTVTTITFAPSVSIPGSVSVSASPTSGSLSYKYVVTALSDILEESLASAEVTATNDLATSPNKNTVSWAAVTGASRYNVYKDDNGVHGYIGQTPDTSFVDDNIEADVLISPPENQTPFNSTDNYPSTASYHDQRRVFSATNNNPQSTWMTRPGTEANLSKSIPSQDDDSILFTLSARQYNQVRHIVPLDELLIFTSATEWKLTTENSDALTPTTIALRPQSYVGSGTREPIVSGDAVLFIADLGGHVYDMNYSFETDQYKPRDISIIAPHLFDSYTISDWAYSSVPVSLIWAVRSDGKLVGLTYLSGQKPDVLGWHLHETDGEFESVAVIPESSGEKMLYVVVKRRINGVDRRFIERLHSRIFSTVKDAFHVDSGLSYDDPKTITAATQANPVVITSASHGFSDGDVVQISDVSGIGTETGMTELNGNRYTVQNKATNTFELKGANGSATITVTDAANIAVGTKITLTLSDGSTVVMTATDDDPPASPNEFSLGDGTNNGVADNIAVGTGGVLGLNNIANLSAPNPAANVITVTETPRLSTASILAIASDDPIRIAVTNETGIDGAAYTAYVSGGKARKEITVVNGLHHLIGESVAIYADGSVAPKQTVAADGSITLTQGAGRIHIGLSYTSDIQTLPIVQAKGDGLGQGQLKSVSKIHLRVDTTRGPSQVGPDYDHLVAYAQRTSEAYGEPTALVSNEIEIALDASWTRGGQIVVRQTDPSPLTVLSLTTEVEFGAA